LQLTSASCRGAEVVAFRARAFAPSIVRCVQRDPRASCSRSKAADDLTAIGSLRSLSPTTRDGYCLYNLWQQWSQAFSYDPGRVDALQPILTLARATSGFGDDDTLCMYELPEWANLVSMRGPLKP
jgi:hypothetical protein